MERQTSKPTAPPDPAGTAYRSAEAPPSTWARSIGAGLLFVALAVIVQLVRQPGVRSWNTIWAEDGRQYTNDALSGPALQTLLRTYSGYAQFVDRVLVLGVRLLPPRAYAAYLAATAAVVTALIGLVVVRSARSWVRSSALRWSLGVMVVAAPVAFSDINAALANVGWPFMVGGFWAVASREEGRFDTPVRALTVLLGALTTVTQLVLLPWAIVMAVHRRRRSDLIVLGSLVLGLGIQGLTVLTADLGDSDTPRSPLRLLELLGLRVFGSLVIGERWLAHLSTRATVMVVVGSVAAVVVMVILARPERLDPDRRILVAGAALTGIGSYLAMVWYRGTSFVDLWVPEGYQLISGRYGYLPVLLLFSALVVLVDASGRNWLRVLLLAQTAFVIATSLTLTNWRSSGPSWTTTVREAEASCQAEPDLDHVQVSVPPSSDWYVVLDCDRLR